VWAKSLLAASYLVVLLSVWLWQTNVLAFQLVIQVALSIFLIRFFYQHFIDYIRTPRPAVTFDQQGQWTEVIQGQGSSWRLTAHSRLTAGVLFVHLVSALDPKHCKWLLLFKDQLNQRDYRRVCRVIIYQQQTRDGI
jgi:hypothetical protein